MLKEGQAGTVSRKVALLLAALSLTAPALAQNQGEEEESWEDFYSSDSTTFDNDADGVADEDGDGDTDRDGSEGTSEAATAPSALAEEPPLATIPVGELPPPPLPETRRSLDEIVVTAQKREQAMQDVPISMSALTGEFLVEQGVTDITEALQLVPNASVDAAGFFAAPRVRGFTFNNNNKSFEPPVGMVLDGVPHTRVEYFLAALFDVQRMEVLRGPQGTSFGKNTTAGLIHVISNGPSADPGGFLSAELGELDRRHVQAAYGGALVEGLNFRIAGLYDARDGFIRNTTADIIDTAPERLKDRDRTGLRASFEIPDLWGSRLQIAYEDFSLFDGGAALEALETGPTFQEAIRRYDPNADFIPGNYVHSQDLEDFRDVSIKSVRGLWEMGIGDWSFTGIAAYSMMEQELALDTDFTPAEAINGFGNDRSPTSYLELRTVLPTLDGFFGLSPWGSTNALVGITASRRQILDSNFRFGVNNGPFYDLVSAAGADASGENQDVILGNLLNEMGINPTDVADSYEEFDQIFEQTSTDLSLFGHMTWQFTDSWGLELGARYTQETKSGTWNSRFNSPEPNVTLRAIGSEEFNANRRRDDSNLQPKVSLNWTASDALSVFLHWEKGFKGGGFNAFAFREGIEDPPPPGTEGQVGDFSEDDLVFEEEVATNVGLDFKMKLLQGAAQLNVSLFRQVATDFQVLIRENPRGTIGLGTSRVVNADKALSQGVEADLQWLATDWLTVVGSLGVLDTEFLKFLDNECPAGASNANQDGDDNPRCDGTGKSFPFAPELSGTLALRLNLPISDLGFGRAGGLSFVAGALMEYESDQLLDVDLEEKKRQGAYTRYKADLGLKSLENGWTLRVVGENLTNTVTHIRYGDVFEDVVVGSQRQPRLFYLQFRQDF